MANVPHEALHHIFREQPSLFSKAMSHLLQEEFPEVHGVAVLNSDLTEVKPLARYADTVLKVETDEGAEIIVIEPRPEPRRRNSEAGRTTSPTWRTSTSCR